MPNPVIKESRAELEEDTASDDGQNYSGSRRDSNIAIPLDKFKYHSQFGEFDYNL